MLKEELKQIDSSDSAVKKTGITIGVVLILNLFTVVVSR